MVHKLNIEFKVSSSGSLRDNLFCSMFLPQVTVFTNMHVLKELFINDFLIIVNTRKVFACSVLL